VKKLTSVWQFSGTSYQGLDDNFAEIVTDLEMLSNLKPCDLSESIVY
jgi:hypothetical protein